MINLILAAFIIGLLLPSFCMMLYVCIDNIIQCIECEKINKEIELRELIDDRVKSQIKQHEEIKHAMPELLKQRNHKKQ